ncbi:MAG TPA: sulfatase-like hydrolase/transferase [Candidatus Acidoferrales bacterium]|nr:sulfatase-like hydrolase/transferase [Candidatus Acidoferrales bacterium]
MRSSSPDFFSDAPSPQRPASGVTRRALLQTAPAALAPLASGPEPAAAPAKPNIVLFISDQFRWDCVGAMGLNPMNLTPNIDAMASRGVLFRNAFTNQPVCAPARATLFSGQYPARHGVWRNGLGLPPDADTLAGCLRKGGYSANYLGKWHLAANHGDPQATRGPVSPEQRGGFLDLWQAANVLEFTSHAYEGELYDNDGSPIRFSGVYRADFMTGLARRFLRSAKPPFLLALSYLETHHQNDTDSFDAPREYAGRYKSCFVPQDLRPLPGTWPSQLPDYYGCVRKIDEAVGAVRSALVETGLDRNTIFIFTSDHGCHFKTRNAEYKRSPHESSIHVPLVIEGPRFNRPRVVSELVSLVDIAPTLLAAAGVAVPQSMQGCNFLRLAEGPSEGWRNEVYFEMSETSTGRGLRTPRYTLGAAVPKLPGWTAAASGERYVEYALYDLFADPYQHVNLAGTQSAAEVSADLRRRLAGWIVESGSPPAAVDPAFFPYI